MMTTKFDKVLSDLLAKFNIDSNIQEEVRRIVIEVIKAEINELESLKPRVMNDIISVIEYEAKEIAKQNKT